MIDDSNDDLMVNVYLKDGGIHRVKLVDAAAWSDQNKDKVTTRTRKARRPMFSDDIKVGSEESLNYEDRLEELRSSEIGKLCGF